MTNECTLINWDTDAPVGNTVGNFCTFPNPRKRQVILHFLHKPTWKMTGITVLLANDWSTHHNQLQGAAATGDSSCRAPLTPTPLTLLLMVTHLPPQYTTKIREWLRLLFVQQAASLAHRDATCLKINSYHSIQWVFSLLHIIGLFLPTFLLISSFRRASYSPCTNGCIVNALSCMGKSRYLSVAWCCKRCRVGLAAAASGWLVAGRPTYTPAVINNFPPFRRYSPSFRLSPPKTTSHTLFNSLQS